MDKSPEARTTARLLRPNLVVERKLGALDAVLAEALSYRPRRSDVDDSLFAEINARTDFLRTLIAAERDCHGDARPEHQVEAEARFAVLERAFRQWAAQSGPVLAPPARTEEEEEDQRGDDQPRAPGSGSTGCSCTESCFGFDFTGQDLQEATFDGKRDLELQDRAADARKAAPVEVAAAATRSTTARWRRRAAALCGAAGVLAAVALAAGLALEFAAVAQQSVYLVPT
ncbi:hypothetical protein BRADI_5g17920v3 [Brachypodium distachyon]|uniref:DUF7610 domain-containing protein n=1 Tax=Brachypodium distachyon TaxID=15368 RepID=A0A0Q3GSI0_BRADI|nr:hypothetical protein BRADI_5g17920v3 [Brachypodium distachyon]